ncbi:MAG: hypothetical protein EOO77_14930 [Oxalobacteraceae bacterium]|nr:MAG: hypothetical protein EOO77_14930 [Oxalobacteraceae bacterium]
MSELFITLEGYPENVQRIADAIEYVFPGLIAWVQSEDCTESVTIKIEGYENPAMPSSMLKKAAA